MILKHCIYLVFRTFHSFILVRIESAEDLVIEGFTQNTTESGSLGQISRYYHLLAA
jgi:hypothetical protein